MAFLHGGQGIWGEVDSKLWPSSDLFSLGSWPRDLRTLDYYLISFLGSLTNRVYLVREIKLSLWCKAPRGGKELPGLTLSAAVHSSSGLVGDLGPGQLRWANTTEGRDSGGRMWIPQQEASSSHASLSTNMWISFPDDLAGNFQNATPGPVLARRKAFYWLGSLFLYWRWQWCGVGCLCVFMKASQQWNVLSKVQNAFPHFPRLELRYIS